MLVRAEEKDGVVIFENVLSVAVMRIKIDDENLFKGKESET